MNSANSLSIKVIVLVSLLFGSANLLAEGKRCVLYNGIYGSFLFDQNLNLLESWRSRAVKPASEEARYVVKDKACDKIVQVNLNQLLQNAYTKTSSDAKACIIFHEMRFERVQATAIFDRSGTQLSALTAPQTLLSDFSEFTKDGTCSSVSSYHLFELIRLLD